MLCQARVKSSMGKNSKNYLINQTNNCFIAFFLESEDNYHKDLTIIFFFKKIRIFPQRYEDLVILKSFIVHKLH